MSGFEPDYMPQVERHPGGLLEAPVLASLFRCPRCRGTAPKGLAVLLDDLLEGEAAAPQLGLDHGEAGELGFV